MREVIDDAFRDDAEVEVRIAQLQGLLPTFDPSGPPVTREHALWLAREHLVATYPDQFSDSPQMRWEDVGARYQAGPAWTLTLKYL